MQQDHQRAYWLELGGLTLGSILLFRFGLLGLVFLVPIQLVWIRRGEESGLLASAGFLVGIALLKGVDLIRLRQIAGPEEVAASLVLLDLVFAAGLLLGLFAMNSERLVVSTGENATRVLTVAERMLAAIGVGAAVYGPTIGLVVAGDAADAIIATQIEMLRPLFSATGASSDEIGLLTEIVMSALLSGLLFGYFVLLIGNWWIGIQFAFKSRFSLPAGNPVMARLAGYELTEFRLPTYLVWALIGAWGGVLASITLELGWISYLFWNAAFVMLALYAIQGIAIVWFYLDKRKMQRGARVGLAVAFVIGLLIPGLQLLIGLGLPGLGVSEIWIDYHRLKGSEEVP